MNIKSFTELISHFLGIYMYFKKQVKSETSDPLKLKD